MLNAVSAMLTETLETPIDLGMRLLDRYSFDLNGYSASVLIEQWLKNYPDRWIYLAVVEALHQGRYKALSVEQILAIWQRKGQAQIRFNHEFERLVCGNFSHLWRKSDRPTEEKNPPTPKLDITKIKLLAVKNNSLDQQTKLNNPPISQFSPHPTDTKEFYGKLQAISRDRA